MIVGGVYVEVAAVARVDRAMVHTHVVWEEE